MTRWSIRSNTRQHRITVAIGGERYQRLRIAAGCALVPRTALVAEAQRTTARLSLSSELNINGQPYSLIWTNPSVLEANVTALKFFALLQYDYYKLHPDPFLRAHALKWLQLADMLAWIPADWAFMNGSLISTTSAPGVVFYSAVANDGIVPWNRSAYPSGTVVEMPRSIFGDLAHTDQTANGTMINQVRSQLQQVFGVAPRPLALQASISGASVVPPNVLCNYSGSASNGTAPYSFEWYSGSTLVGSSPLLSLSVPEPGLELSLVVRDINNQVASSALFLSTDNYSSGCF